MSKHHSPLDPRDPLSPAFYFAFVDDRGNGGRRGGGRPSGCGCVVVLLAIIVVVLIISSLTSR